jgi:hypothetical protein
MTESTAKRLLPVLIGIFLTVIMLALLGYLSNKRRAAAAAAPPVLHILSPVPHSVIDSPLIIHFRTRTTLQLRPAGWGIGNLHLHARVNSVEHMPAVTDIQPTDSGYLWTLPLVRRGPLTIQLGWADPVHRELKAGTSSVNDVTLR